MHTYKLNARTHASFLESQRHDPITGDAFKAGDEVVFCASCRSAFLSESWNYMGQTHCEQSDTLTDFPKAKPLNLKDEPAVKDQLFWANVEVDQKQIPAKKTVGKYWLLWQGVRNNLLFLGLLGFYALRASILAVYGIFWSTSTFNFILLFTIAVTGSFTLYAWILGHKKFFAFGENYLHFFKQKLHYSRVKRLYVKLTFSRILVTIEKMNGEAPKTLEFTFSALEYSKYVALHYGFLRISQATEVHLYGDIDLVEKLSREYEGNLHLWEDAAYL